MRVRRTTVKEVRTWMKTLEENRYKKLSGADCRRVSWLVNNHMTEDYESMPISMRKKWSKAAYGRERQLATEFIKHLQSKQMNENKLEGKFRSLIKEYIQKRKLTEAKETIFDVAARVMEDKQAKNYKSKKGMVKVDIQTANLLTKVWKKVNPKMSLNN